MAYSVFRPYVDNLPVQRALDVAFFGGGPLPELIGLTEALAETHHVPEILNATDYDVSGHWSRVAGISMAFAEKLNPGLSIRLTREPLDFSAPLLAAVRNQLRDVHLAAFQNCCNELAASPAYQPNVQAVAEALPTGALLVFADQSSYSGTERAMRRVEINIANSGFQMLRRFSSGDEEIDLPFWPPPDVMDNFFDGRPSLDPLTGEWSEGEFRRSKIKFSSSVFKKLG